VRQDRAGRAGRRTTATPGRHGCYMLEALGSALNPSPPVIHFHLGRTATVTSSCLVAATEVKGHWGRHISSSPSVHRTRPPRGRIHVGAACWLLLHCAPKTKTLLASFPLPCTEPNQTLGPTLFVSVLEALRDDQIVDLKFTQASESCTSTRQ
jgi:hypothetical protein